MDPLTVLLWGLVALVGLYVLYIVLMLVCVLVIAKSFKDGDL